MGLEMSRHLAVSGSRMCLTENDDDVGGIAGIAVRRHVVHSNDPMTITGTCHWPLTASAGSDGETEPKERSTSVDMGLTNDLTDISPLLCIDSWSNAISSYPTYRAIRFTTVLQALTLLSWQTCISTRNELYDCMLACLLSSYGCARDSFYPNIRQLPLVVPIMEGHLRVSIGFR